MKVKQLNDGEYIDVEVETPEPIQPEITKDEALQTFLKTLASPETTSIAKIRAAAKQFINDTEGGDEM